MSIDPISLLVLTGGGLQAAASIQEGKIAAAQGSFSKKIALRNEESLRRQGRAELEASKVEEERIARKEKIFKASQRAAVGKQGTGLAGASLAVLTDTAAQFSMDRNLALRRGILRKGQLYEQGAITAAQGRWAKTLGNQAKRLSYIKAGASILSSAALASYYGGGPGTTGTQYGVSPSGGMPVPHSTSTYNQYGATIARY